MTTSESKWTVAEGIWLDDVVARAAQAPATFLIPPETERKALSEGDWAKLAFYFPDKGCERLWVEVVGTIWKDDELTYVGALKSEPFHDDLKVGAVVRFQPQHVCGKDRPPKGWKG
jgi:hypothetical protein